MAFKKKAKKAPETFHVEYEMGGPMRLADSVRDLCQEITQSYDARVAGVATVRRETAAKLKGFQQEMKNVRHQLRQKAADLRRFLGHTEAFRLRDFRSMHQGIRARQETRNHEVGRLLWGAQQMVAGFRRDHHAAASHWRSMDAALGKRRASAA